MTWEETVIHFRNQEQNKQVAKDAYLEADLVENVERFKASSEWIETIKEVERILPNNKLMKVLDIGAGNGISSIAFASLGFEVVALEPDGSNTVGSGAIKTLVNHYKFDNVKVVEAFGENLSFEDNTFDIVYGRQVMHHAYNLSDFVKEAARVLKKGGVFITVRDHVIKNGKDKELFLERHPLHKYYGGENAFHLSEYENAIRQAKLVIKKRLSPSQSPINYSPWSRERIGELIEKKIGKIFNISIFVNILWLINLYRLESLPGKLYSFVAIKE